MELQGKNPDIDRAISYMSSRDVYVEVFNHGN